MSRESPSFTPALFAFLTELRANNDREWFAANKARYVDEVQEPALAFVEDVGHRMPQVSPYFGGKIFRIHRDVRFAKDKSPYKTHTGIQFRHETGKNPHAPGFYLHLEPSNVFMGCGTWRPEGDTLRRIREAIARRPEQWRAIVAAPQFAERFHFGGESLKRPPAGFNADHPLIDDIKRKDFIAITNLDEQVVTAPDFLQTFDALCRDGGPLMRFLCEAAGVAY